MYPYKPSANEGLICTNEGESCSINPDNIKLEQFDDIQGNQRVLIEQEDTFD